MPNAALQPPPHDREFIRAILILGTFAFVAAAIIYFVTIIWTGPIPRDVSTLVVGRDFLNFWISGRAAWSGNPGTLYDPQALAHAISLLMGPDYPGQTWGYPPGMLFLAAPFARLPYLAALLCWTVAGFSFFAWSALRFIPDRNAALALIISPAAMMCLICGQKSLLFASLFLAIFSLLDRRPLCAGILIAILGLKPQFGLLFPIMLLIQWRWRTFFAAAVTTLLIGGAAAAIWGPGIWLDYFHKGIPGANLVLIDPTMIGAPFMPTVFMNMRVAGASYSVAMLVQTIAGVLAGAALIWACFVRRRADCMLLFALIAGCTQCAVPYLLSYDVLPLTAAAMLLLAAGKLDGPGRRLAQLVYWLPLIQVPFGLYHIPGPALIAAMFTAYTFVRIVRPESKRIATEPLPLPLPA